MPGPVSGPLSGAGRLRLLCWNVRDLHDPGAAARVVRSADPDLVCLQEFPRRVRPLPRLAAFAAGAGLFVVAGGRRAAGCVLLAAPRLDVLAGWSRALRIPGPAVRRPVRPRGIAAGVVRLPSGPPVQVASVHLPPDPVLRRRHAVAVHDLLAAAGLTTVIGADLNEPAGGPAWRTLEPLAADPWPDAPPTFPAHRPTGRIDAVLVGDGIRAEPADWRPDPDDVRRATDHLPVLAELTID